MGDDDRGLPELWLPNRAMRRSKHVARPCSRCGERSQWMMRGRRKRPDELGQATPAAPWGDWHDLCTRCVEPVKEELQLAELLELELVPIDGESSRNVVAIPAGTVRGVG